MQGSVDVVEAVVVASIFHRGGRDSEWRKKRRGGGINRLWKRNDAHIGVA